MLFGNLVASAKLEAGDLAMLKMFMAEAYEETAQSFKQGMSIAREEKKVDENRGGAHGGKVPTKAEADKILAEKGMSWQEVVVVSSVLFNGTVPTLAEIEAEGYGSDPGQWAGAKEWRKNGKPSLYQSIKTKDPESYRRLLQRGAARMANGGSYSTGASQLMLFVGKLSAMTFDQGMPHLFLNYCEEHVEVHKGQGLMGLENPFDQTILTETVLAEKQKTVVRDERMERVIAQAEELVGLEQRVRSRMGEINSIVSRVTALEQRPAPGQNNNNNTRGGPPSADNPCQYCKSPDHFVRDCPKKKEADARRAAEAAAASTSSAPAEA